MPVKIRGLEYLEKKLDTALMPAVNDISQRLAQNFVLEMPKQTGKMANSVSVSVKKIGILSISAIITIGEKYARAVWKGLDRDVYSVSPKPGNSGMSFPVEDWPQYDGRFGNVKYFFFRQPLTNYIPPNDFIGRAIKNLGFIKGSIAKQFKIVFGGR